MQKKMEKEKERNQKIKNKILQQLQKKQIKEV